MSYWAGCTHSWVQMGPVESLALVGLLGGALGLFLLRSREHVGTTVAPTVQPRTLPKCAPGYLPVLNAQELFQEINAEPFLTRIEQALGLAPENHSVDVTPILNAVAEFVQLLPASESHHHAHPGGLLTHLLEVAAGALYRAEESKLPVGRPTEEQLLHAPRWRFAVLAAALLHDIGKPISDVDVTILSAQGEPAPWDGLGGRMGAFGHCYRVSFPLKHEYSAHKRLPVILLTSIVPPSTMRWLSGDPGLLPSLIAYLSGETDGGAIGKLVKAADQKSVADNLLAGSRTRFGTARQVPMIERLMDALRRMLAEGSITLNREGAAGFCDGQEMWFVAGTIADKTREYLNHSEIREAGAAGIPTDNSRLFDTWLDYGAVVANGAGAIWRATVTVERAGSPWTQHFTMLRFPLSILFPEGTYPTPLNGRIDTVSLEDVPQTPGPGLLNRSSEAEASAPLDTSQTISQDASLDDTLVPCPVSFDLESTSNSTIGAETKAEPEIQLLAMIREHQMYTGPGAARETDDYLDDDDSASSLPVAPLGTSIGLTIPTAPVSPAAPLPPVKSVLGTVKQPTDDIERFVAWIQAGIGNGTIKYNWASAFVHFVDAGMLLITPRVFREYLDQSGQPVDPTGKQVKQLQRSLQKSGYALKNPPSTYLHYYRIKNATNPAKDMVVGYLIPKPDQFFNPVPDTNPLLEPSRPAEPPDQQLKV